MKAKLLFPTTIYAEDLPNAKELNKYLIKHIKQWHKKDKGIQKTNRGGWHSTVDMHKKKEYEPLVKELICMATGVHREEGYTEPLILGNMWANINYPHCFNKDHIHPNCCWSGVYYIKIPQNCGSLHIEDPRTGSNMIMPKQLPKNKLPQRLWRSWDCEPKEGTLLMFPAFLNHCVNVNESKLKGEKGWRISVSFNFIQ
jgi:uncharacterized protein (TIGR02466 family)